MGEVGEVFVEPLVTPPSNIATHNQHQTSIITISKSQRESVKIITIKERSVMNGDDNNISTTTRMQSFSEEEVSGFGHQKEINVQDSWLPITESRKGNVYTSLLHLLCSGIGIQALSLPVAFSALGWYWGILILSTAFVWQLYTTWLLVHLHESVPGTRYSRYLHLSISAFGEKLGKLAGIFPVMYLSGGTCVMLIINGGMIMEHFYQLMCGNNNLSCISKTLSGAEWYLVFICLAILVSQFFPNLNSLAGVSLIGAITAVGYCTMSWILSINKGRPEGVTYKPVSEADMGRIRVILNGIGIISLAFRGHNVVLEIQGTMPSSKTHPCEEPMWRGVIMSSLLIAMCVFPLAIGGYWAYGNMIVDGGILSAYYKFHGENTPKSVMGMAYILVLINFLCTFQIFAMPTLDNWELKYTTKKNKRCTKWLRSSFRVLFGGLTYFVAVTFPFLGSLSALIGGITLPLAFAYPCFMWLAMKKACRNGGMWWFNLVLGCFGIVLSILVVIGALWTLVSKGLNANFFNPDSPRHIFD